jgi:hypothetical protein
MDNVIDFLFAVILGLLSLLLALFIAIVICAAVFGDPAKKCAVYGPERTVQGYMPGGKIMVPTTYQTRDCLVWEEKKK